MSSHILTGKSLGCASIEYALFRAAWARGFLSQRVKDLGGEPMVGFLCRCYQFYFYLGDCCGSGIVAVQQVEDICRICVERCRFASFEIGPELGGHGVFPPCTRFERDYSKVLKKEELNRHGNGYQYSTVGFLQSFAIRFPDIIPIEVRYKMSLIIYPTIGALQSKANSKSYWVK